VKRCLGLVFAFAVVALVATAAALYFGAYDIAATEQHLRPTYWLLKATMRRSVEARARELTSLEDPSFVRHGAALYREHCVRCHGAPGVAPERFALGLTPLPENLSHAALLWRPEELYWILERGIKMSGMPAWRHRLSSSELWSLVAFLKRLPSLSPQAYAEIPDAPGAQNTATLAAPDAVRGKKAIPQYGCSTCHVIPGIVGAIAPVGPTLSGVASRSYLAGIFPNTRENLIDWIRTPQKFKPQSAMPDLGVSPQDAEDIAAYLRTLR